MGQSSIVIKGAREHNLKNVDVEIPRDELVVITGLSGSGKSSLAFDTMYAEGQRRYVESLSSYARQFLGQMSKPDLDSIDGLSPAVSIDQKTTSKNPRSTVGTVTEIYDYLRLLFARTGVPHCPECGREIKAQTTDQVTDDVLALGEGKRALLMAPVVSGKKGEFTKLFQDLQKEGFSRVRIDGEVQKLGGEPIVLNKKVKHFIDVVVDRVVLKQSAAGRISQAVEMACNLADGRVLVKVLEKGDEEANITTSSGATGGLAKLSIANVRRLKVFSGIGARNIGQYNAKVQQGLELNDEPAKEMPYIVIIIDELADLMMNVGKEVEFSISRLAQLARAAGIHLIVATQRPSTNVVTGLIKANITNRIAFNVASGIDSRVILDTPGAENLIGLGDLLLSKPELAKPQRIQGCFVSEDEIAAVVEKLKSQGEPDYHNDILKTNLITLGDSSPDGSGGTAHGSDDPLVWEAADIVVSAGVGSTSNLQRRLSVGYSRAGRIMDLLEAKGIVGPQNGSKPREVLVDALELETLKAFEEHDSQ